MRMPASDIVAIGAPPRVLQAGMMWVINEAARPAWTATVARIQRA
jgi:hypothetical protein